MDQDNAHTYVRKSLILFVFKFYCLLALRFADPNLYKPLAAYIFFFNASRLFSLVHMETFNLKSHLSIIKYERYIINSYFCIKFTELDEEELKLKTQLPIPDPEGL